MKRRLVPCLRIVLSTLWLLAAAGCSSNAADSDAPATPPDQAPAGDEPDSPPDAPPSPPESPESPESPDAPDAPNVPDSESPSTPPDEDPAPPASVRTTIVHLFEWRWPDIARECEQVLGPRGFAAVQVSPPQEHAVFDFAPWWQRYQPVSYQLVSRSGDRAAFADMVQRCAAAGVDVYVDAILNHMSFRDRGIGSAGTPFEKYLYPGLYEDEHFHDCRRGIESDNDRWEVQHCDLATAPDLATGTEYVRDQLAGYLQDLVDIGVAGVRLDGAKHMAATDIAAIVGRVNGDLYVYQEVIDFGGGAVRINEYVGLGDVTEFRYSGEIARVFRRGKLAWLHQFGSAWGFVRSDQGVVFVDNHDNQRGHGAPGDAISFKDGRLHELANIFMLAWPYGYPRLMSSYAFEDGTQGPPSIDGQTLPALEPDGQCAANWICEHRKPDVLAMVEFRNATSETFFVNDWWSNGNDQIAFGRGDRGFVVINREEASRVDRRFQTGLPPGRYCDVLSGEFSSGSCTGRVIEVDAARTARIEVGPLDAVALHANARLAP